MMEVIVIMLIKCRECGLQVSNLAVFCPHCGCPVPNGEEKTNKKKKIKKGNARRRLPNGFGQISEIKNRNLRNPYRVMVSVGKADNGRPICRLLKPQAYYATYNEAYAALVDYNRNPYDLELGTTAKELYNEWTDVYFRTLKNDSSAKAVESAWAYCSSVYNMRVKDIRARHIKGCMEDGTIIVGGQKKKPSAAMKNKIKSLFNLMLDYAYEYELVDRNYARTFKLNEDVIKEIQTVKKQHIPFTDEEMEILWEHVDDKNYVDLVIIQCYGGWRPQELGLIELENVNLEQWIMTGGIKTEAGRNRIVPIHSRIRPYVERRYRQAQELGSKYIFNYIDSDRRNNNIQLTYSRYSRIFERIRDELGLNMNHRPHDGRKHFVTRAKEYNVDEYAIKYIVGHKIMDITEKVYTSRETSWLKKEVEKIK